MTSSHPFVPHYETQDERMQAEQLNVVLVLYFHYERNCAATAAAFVTLGWNQEEADRAVRDAVKLL